MFMLLPAYVLYGKSSCRDCGFEEPSWLLVAYCFHIAFLLHENKYILKSITCSYFEKTKPTIETRKEI